MSIRVSTNTSNILVRVGQENAIKVLSSASGGDDFSSNSETSINVIGGIGSVTQLYVSGISTLNSVNINSGIATLSNLNVTGLSTFINARFYELAEFYSSVYYDSSNTYGISYFDSNNYISSTESSLNPSLTESNLVLSTNESGVPSWSNTIDGGTY